MRQPERALFNRPFECVQVENGESSLVLPKLNLGKQPAIIWLDYDSDLSGPVFDDITIVTRHVAEGSICIVTVKADIRLVSSCPFSVVGGTQHREGFGVSWGGTAV